MLAEAERLEGRADALIGAATAQAHAAGLLDTRASLLTCPAAAPLQQEAASLRRAMEVAATPPAAASTTSVAPMLAPSTQKVPAVTTSAPIDRAVGIRAVAAGFNSMPADVAAAIADPTVTVTAFALDQAGKAQAIRAAEARAIEEDHVVARIVGDPSIVAQSAARRRELEADARAAPFHDPAREAEISAAVDRIVASAELARPSAAAFTIDAIAARIAAS